MDSKTEETANKLCDAANKLPPAAQDKLLAFAMGMVAMAQTLQQPLRN